MSTVYNTPRGVTYDPLILEVWAWDGTAPEGRLEFSEKAEVTWAMQGAGTAVVDTPLTSISKLLMPCDGRYLLIARFNGLRHVSMPVKTRVHADEKAPDDLRIEIVTASAWSMLDAEVVLPVPSRGWDVSSQQQKSKEFFTYTGSVDSTVRRLISVGADQIEHPIIVLPSHGRGPKVTVAARMELVGKLIPPLLAGSGLWVDLSAWLPGDDPPAVGTTGGRPTILADVKPYREKEGLVWTVRGGDITSWEWVHERPTATHLIIHDQNKHPDQQILAGSVNDIPVWARRGMVTDFKSPDENPEDAGNSAIAGKGPKEQVKVKVSPGLTWEFGDDGGYPRQYQVGDKVTIGLPGSEVEQVVTEVTVTMTPASLTVQPVVGTPDTVGS